jgi:hypothetical protein
MRGVTPRRLLRLNELRLTTSNEGFLQSCALLGYRSTSMTDADPGSITTALINATGAQRARPSRNPGI